MWVFLGKLALPFFWACILVAIGIVLVANAIWIVLNYYMMRNADYILTENWTERYEAIQTSEGQAAYRLQQSL